MQTNPTASFQVLTFKRCGIPFGVEVAQVREIRKFEELRPLALAIHPMIGLVALGERIIPVFDPQAFGAAARQPAGPTLTTVICGREGAEIALLADEVQAQVTVQPGQMTRRSDPGTEWLAGEVELEAGRKLLLLAVQQLVRLVAAEGAELAAA